MPKEPLSFANMSPIGFLAVRDLASESVPVGSFLTTALLKKCVVTMTAPAEDQKIQLLLACYHHSDKYCIPNLRTNLIY